MRYNPIVGDTLETEDPIYKWTMAALYAVAIAANVWYLWAQNDPAEQAIMVDRVRRAYDAVLAPVRERKRFERLVKHMHFEAWRTVTAPETINEPGPKEPRGQG